jgi:hypothetical protein
MDYKSSHSWREGVEKIREQEKTIYETCSVCKKQVMMLIDDCPNCRSKICLVCKVNNDGSVQTVDRDWT